MLQCIVSGPTAKLYHVELSITTEITVSSLRRALRAAVLLAAHAVVLQDNAVILHTFLAPMITFAAVSDICQPP